MSCYQVQSIKLTTCLLVVAVIISLFMSQLGITIVLLFLALSMVEVSVVINHMGKRIDELEKKLEASASEAS